MKISYNWLKDYIKIDKTPEQLADDLSLFGHEVENIEKVGDDTVLDFEITPNRGDCLSVLGMAREIAALYNLELKIQKVELKEDRVDQKIEVKVQNPKLCPRFSARIIDNIKIGPSPDWMVQRLKSYGFRSVNNVVDVTNYVMLATGQPLHAFDYDKISQGIFKIRLSKEREEVITLDGISRILSDEIMIIEDDQKIYDLVGIMGGFKSEVDEKTKTIVLVGSIFDPVLIRRASKYLNHVTDSSYRYERGVDYEGNIYGIDMAAGHIKDLISSAKIGKLIDIKNQPLESREIKYDPKNINRLLGTQLSADDIAANLSRLNFEVAENTAKVPSYRLFDIKIWQDLAEEVARVYGYNNLEKNNLEKAESSKNAEFIGTEIVKDQLAELGFTEVYSYSFADKSKLEVLGLNPEDQPQIEKPLSSETEYLRPNLVASLLGVIARNPWSPEVNIFEVEAVFGKSAKRGPADSGDQEKWQLGIASVGKSSEMIEKAIKKLNLNTEIKAVEQKILDEYKIRRPVKYATTDIDSIKLPTGDYSLEVSDSKYRPVSKYPPTVRDLSFVFEKNVKEDEVITSIKSISGKILIAELFDTYRMADERKSLAFHIWLQDLEKPISDVEAKDIIDKVIVEITAKYNAALRSK